jgi:nucleotide-binding universal stress UspA family protein
MIHLKRILWPTDFSDNSKVAGVYACTLAEQFGAELHLLHVVEDVLTLIPEAGMVFPPPSEYQPKVRASAEKALSNLPDASWGQANVVMDEPGSSTCCWGASPRKLSAKRRAPC